MRTATVVAAIFGLALLIGSLSDSPNNVSAADADAKVTYAKDIQPVLKDKCYGCHNAAKKKAGINLQSGYASVAMIVKPEKPDDSKLFKCLVGGKGTKLMPPKNPLPAETVAKFKAWIEGGAKNN